MVEPQATHAVLEELVDEVLLRGGVLIDRLVVDGELVRADDDLERVVLPGGERLQGVVQDAAEPLRALVFEAVETDGLHELVELLEGVAACGDRQALRFGEGLLGGPLEHLHQVAARPVGRGGRSFQLSHRAR
jgi:precorrin-6B methylase 2